MIRRAMILLTAIAAIAPTITAAAEPEKLAEMARFDVLGDAAVGTLGQGRSLEGGGTLERMNWVPESERSRSYTVNFPVNHRGWRTAAIRFTPARSGTVRITLMGPWQEAEKGVLYKQEVLWDDVRVEGAPLENGGFEASNLGQAAGWHGPGIIAIQSRDVPAVEGTSYARTWHNQTLSTQIEVVGGQPVTIRLSAARSGRRASSR